MKCACTFGWGALATFSESAELSCACPIFRREKFAEPTRCEVAQCRGYLSNRYARNTQGTSATLCKSAAKSHQIIICLRLRIKGLRHIAYTDNSLFSFLFIEVIVSWCDGSVALWSLSPNLCAKKTSISTLRPPHPSPTPTCHYCLTSCMSFTWELHLSLQLV